MGDAGERKPCIPASKQVLDIIQIRINLIAS